MLKRESNQPFFVIDTTLRDGLQNPESPEHGKFSLSLAERIEIFSALMKFGVPYVEIFSPLVNVAEHESALALITVRSDLSQHFGQTRLLAHVRCEEKDVQAAIDVGVDGLNMYMGTSQESQRFNHGKNLKEVAKRARTLMEQIRRDHPHLELRFSGEDAFRTPLKDLFVVYDQLAETVDRFGTPDTVGVAQPQQVKQRVRALKRRYPQVGLEGHFHNDRGYSLINAVTAVLAGMEYMDTSVLGLAERSGITSLTGLLFNLYLENQQLVEGFNLEESYPLNVLVASIMRMQVPYTEPISLTNNTHSAGVHTSAMLKNSQTYQAHPLTKFGVTETRLLLGALSGWHVVQYYLMHVLNFEPIEDQQAKEITALFKERAARNAHNESPTELLRTVAQEQGLLEKNKPVTHLEVL
jgi:homocitrate synthase